MKYTLFAIVLLSFNYLLLASQHRIADTLLKYAEHLSKESNYNDIDHGIIDKTDSFPIPSLDDVGTKQASSINIENINYADSQPRVKITNGIVIGGTNEDSHSFHSLPYAQPPIGPDRFLPPKPAEDFGELDLSFPDHRKCWQRLSCEQANECTEKDGNLTEDCLVVTIDVPKSVNLTDHESPPTDRLPVLFYIHGGFYLSGGGTSYELEARKLSRDAKAIVVRVNYRLGPYGFISYQDGDQFIEGNQGQKDQQLALRWVQDNIEAFGGDKNKVTLFGNSAGSQSIIFHYLSEASRPLFSRGIVQSSPTVFPYQTSVESNRTITRRYLEALECGEGPSCLRQSEPHDLIAAVDKVMVSSLLEGDLFGTIEPFRPVIDGTEYTSQPLTMFKNGEWHTNKEIIVGTTQEEMSYIHALFETSGLPFTKQLFEAINKALLGDENAEIMIDYYSESEDLDYSDNFAEEITDFFFVCPNRALARIATDTSTHSQKSVYLYNFAYPLANESCQIVNNYPPVCGTAYHSSDIVLLLKSAFAYGASFTAEDELVSDMWSTYLGSFASNGDLTSNLDSSLGTFTEWPRYDSNSAEPWQNINLNYPQSSVTSEYKNEICDLWDQTGFYFEDESTTPSSETTSAATTTSDPVTTTSATMTTKTTTNVGEIDTTTDAASSLSFKFATYALCALASCVVQLL